MSKKRVAVIGSGISSAAFYHFLNKDKFDVTFFEKSRGTGGRMSSRRVDDVFFDHGASCFGAIRSKKFKDFIAPFVSRGLLHEWKGNFKYIDGSNLKHKNIEKKERLVCRAQSNILIKEIISKPLQLGLIHFSKRVVDIVLKNQKNSILTDDGEVYDDFDYVISSAPAKQTLQLFPRNFCFFKLLQAVDYQTTFVLMLSFCKNKAIDFSHLAVKNSIISRISYENSKSGDRNFETDCFVINANNLFSKATQYMDHEIIKRDLLDEFLRLTGLSKEMVSDIILHRWLYANSTSSYNYPVLLDTDLNIGAIGDYVKEPRVEMTFESGAEMAETLNYLVSNSNP